MRVHDDVADAIARFMCPKDMASWYLACGMGYRVKDVRHRVEDALAVMTRELLSIRVTSAEAVTEQARSLGYHVYHEDGIEFVRVRLRFQRTDPVTGVWAQGAASWCTGALSSYLTSYNAFLGHNASSYARVAMPSVDPPAIAFPLDFPIEFAAVVLRAWRQCKKLP